MKIFGAENYSVVGNCEVVKFVLFRKQYYYDNQIKEVGATGRAFSTHGKDEKYFIYLGPYY
jgi:hypothetical protein